MSTLLAVSGKGQEACKGLVMELTVVVAVRLLIVAYLKLY